ncbi:MAG: thioredoxin family protein [Rhodospirillales bacterium]|nr:thioredoxin family protein [Rhodospirillales bacterium]MCB9994975.1 thioredoxin family protein [Rhodospirillales bacterium]
MNRRTAVKTLAALAGAAFIGILSSGCSEATQPGGAVQSYNGADDPSAFAQMIADRSQGQVLFTMYETSWCGYCKKLRRNLDAASSQTNLPYTAITIDVDDYPRIAKNFREGRSVPETHIYFEGKEIDSFIGAVAVDTLVLYMGQLNAELFPAGAAAPQIAPEYKP